MTITYDLQEEDFLEVMKFGVNYYLDPNKQTAGRTTGEPRGLGAILDAFTLGKLTEIGVKNVLHINETEKDYQLDFSIKTDQEVANDPDIEKVIENDVERDPKVFIEIKNTSDKDRWIGLTFEQYQSMKTGAKDRDIYMIYATIYSEQKDDNAKTVDLTGMMLKSIHKGDVFDGFADLNGKCKIEFIISGNDLDKYSYEFKKGMNFYETTLFTEKEVTPKYHPIKVKDGGYRKGVKLIKIYKNFNSTITINGKDGILDKEAEVSTFNINGSFRLYESNKRTIIECTNRVVVGNGIFGEYTLESGRYYSFNLETVGRDPKLKRDNHFIAKRRIYQLIADGDMEQPQDMLEKIINDI